MKCYAYIYGKLGVVALVVAETTEEQWEELKRYSDRINTFMGADFRDPYKKEVLEILNKIKIVSVVTQQFKAEKGRPLGVMLAEWTKHSNTRIALVNYEN